MKHYAGRSEDDPPLGGGSFPVQAGYCGEECNFVKCDDGFVYGHFETIQGERDRKLELGNLGADPSASEVEGVDIVWTAAKEGKSPRTVVGWSRNATLFRERQEFGREFPSKQHERAAIGSYMVRARNEDVYLLPVEERNLDLKRGRGWSGQASWWYAEKSSNEDAIEFLAKVRERMDATETLAENSMQQSQSKPRRGRAGAATSESYKRDLSHSEINIDPEHHQLQQRFKKYLENKYREISFPDCYRDDLRYAASGEPDVMVEIKPAAAQTIRREIRTAIGQLLDYKQDQKWAGRQLIVVGARVTDENDTQLALDNGFGIAWPLEKGFEIKWPK